MYGYHINYIKDTNSAQFFHYLLIYINYYNYFWYFRLSFIGTFTYDIQSDLIVYIRSELCVKNKNCY